MGKARGLLLSRTKTSSKQVCCAGSKPGRTACVLYTNVRSLLWSEAGPIGALAAWVVRRAEVTSVPLQTGRVALPSQCPCGPEDRMMPQPCVWHVARVQGNEVLLH